MLEIIAACWLMLLITLATFCAVYWCVTNCIDRIAEARDEVEVRERFADPTEVPRAWQDAKRDLGL